MKCITGLLLFAVLGFCTFAFAQQKPVTAAVAPIPSSVSLQASAESQNKILRAEHSLDQLKNDENDIANQFQTLQREAEQLTARYKADKEKESGLNAAVNEAIEQAWKTSGFSKDKYSFDPANFTFAQRPASKAPEKVAKTETPKPAGK